VIVNRVQRTKALSETAIGRLRHAAPNENGPDTPEYN
jgi:hypothetical protein